MGEESLQERLHGLLEQNGSRWLLVAVGVIILLRLRLILFAAALPILAYWHYSNQPEVASNVDAQADDQGEEDEADLDRPPSEADDDLLDDEVADLGDVVGKKDSEIYNDSFWEDKPESARKKRADDPSFGGKGTGFSWDGGRDELDDLLAGDEDGLGLGPSTGRNGSAEPGGLDGSLGSRRDSGGGGLNDFDFLDSIGNDMDFLGGGGGGKGKGKGKGKSKDGKGKDPNAPREADPKQVFVTNIGDAPEDDIRCFFEEVGEVDRLKVLRNPDGSSKGVCFVTFRTESEAQKALTLHGSNFEGRNLTVRLAHGGNKGKGDKGEGKGRDSIDRDGPVDLGGSERFGAAFGDRERPDRGSSGKGGKGKGKGKDRGEMDELLEDVLADQEGPLRVSDFDFAARRFIAELRSRDRSDGGSRFQEAMEMVLKYTATKDRGQVRKWPAYVFTLLQKAVPDVEIEIRQRPGQKGGGRGGFRGRQDSDDREERDD